MDPSKPAVRKGKQKIILDPVACDHVRGQPPQRMPFRNLTDKLFSEAAFIARNPVLRQAQHNNT